MIWNELLQESESAKDWILSLRRRLHQHPELMYEEFQTSQLVQDTLSDLQIPFESGIAETGVVGTLGTGHGPCIALRADMDALPIHEAADVPFRSQVDGKMHACGHDCHTAMLLGAARVLKQREDSLRGTVKLIFQPAEEGGAGGKRMSDHGVLRNPDVSRIFGLHVWPMLPTGTFGSRAGTFLAAAGEVDITIHGRGGHAAMPHQCIDPVITAAKVVSELQTIVSRELDPMNSAVVSITTIHGGEAYNVIPEQVRLQGTLRALDTTTYQMLQKRVEETASRVAAAARCTADVVFPGNAYPATVNDGNLWDTVQELAGELVGKDHVHELPALMGGEDFAFFAEQVPGCFVGLGIRNEDCGATYSVHHPQFKVDEDALPLGTALHACFAVHSLQ